VNEPLEERDPSLHVHTLRPFNAEPPNEALRHMITPKGKHYRRTHTPVPVIDEASYRVGIEVEGKPVQKFSMADIKKQPVRDIAVTMMCTGNRRSEYNNDDDGDTMGLPWKNGSISTARWSGAPLRHVLNAAGLTLDAAEEAGLRFLTLWGTEEYHISIPLSKGFTKEGDVILAYQMNGQPLPRDHGFPLRVVVPGYVGARSVKWIDRIVLSKEEVDGMHQKGIAYKQLAPNQKELAEVPKKHIEALPPIDSVPVTSAITAPEPGARVARGEALTIAGYAYSGIGLAIIRVDVSIDGGRNWVQGEISRADSQQGSRSGQAWAWVQWQTTVEVPKDATGPLDIVCKAVDDQYNQQPHSTSPIWNIRGILNTSWGRVQCHVGAKSCL
jgi:sulfite oxidase